MAEVLHKAVTKIDSGGRRTKRGKTRAGVEPRVRAEKALDEKLFCAAIFFRVRARDNPSVQFAREQSPAKRRVAERARNKDIIADARRVATHDTRAGFAEQRD